MTAARFTRFVGYDCARHILERARRGICTVRGPRLHCGSRVSVIADCKIASASGHDLLGGTRFEVPRRNCRMRQAMVDNIRLWIIRHRSVRAIDQKRCISVWPGRRFCVPKALVLARRGRIGFLSRMIALLWHDRYPIFAGDPPRRPKLRRRILLACWPRVLPE